MRNCERLVKFRICIVFRDFGRIEILIKFAFQPGIRTQKNEENKGQKTFAISQSTSLYCGHVYISIILS